MASSNDLIAALRELRADPIVASVLRGDPDAATAARLKSVVDPLPPSSPAQLQQDQLLQAGLPPSHVIETQLYYRSRDADREAIGVENWLQHHREALSASETKRLENRLRAEHLFAASQMEMGMLKADHAATSARLLQQSQDLRRQRARDEDEQDGLSARQYADKVLAHQRQRVILAGDSSSPLDLLSPLPREPASADEGDLDKVLAAAPAAGEGDLSAVMAGNRVSAASVDTSVQTPSFLAPRGAILYEPSEEPVLYASGVLPSSSLIMDASQLGEIDEEKNYREKAQLVAAAGAAGGLFGTPVAAAQQQQQQQQRRPLLGPTSELSPSSVPSSVLLAAGASPNVSSHHHHLGLREGTPTELAALREAVEQRDRTIRRLEKQLQDDRFYYETQLSRAKQDQQQAELMGESRVAAMRAQLDQVMSHRNQGRATGSLVDSEYSAEEVQQKLLTVQQMYRASLEEIKEASSKAMEQVQDNCGARIADITAACEKTIADAREAFRRDRFDSLAKQKEQLVLILSKEMELALRESELSFRDSIHEAVSSKIRDEIQLVFRKHLVSDVLPTVQIQMIKEVHGSVVASTQKELEGVLAEKVVQLRHVVRDEVSLLGPKVEQLFGEIANRHDHVLQTVDKSLLDVLSTEIRQVRMAVKDLDAETELQQTLEQQHRAKMSIYLRRIEDLERSFEAERGFQGQVRDSIAAHFSKIAAQQRMDEPVTGLGGGGANSGGANKPSSPSSDRPGEAGQDNSNSSNNSLRDGMATKTNAPAPRGSTLPPWMRSGSTGSKS